MRVDFPGFSRADSLALIGGELCLDFANTRSGLGGPNPLDHLQEVEDVLRWAVHAMVLAERNAAPARSAIEAEPKHGRALLGRARELRELVFRIAGRLSLGEKPEAADVAALSALHAACIAKARLEPVSAGFAWRWDAAASPVEAIIGPVTLSALSLLTQGDLARVRQCEGDHCGWLFYDATKNRSRRWCEMEICGNRAKQKRFQDKKRGFRAE